MPSTEYEVAEPAIIFRRKRSGRLLPWVFDPQVERVNLVSDWIWNLVFCGMTQAIVIDARGRRWTGSQPRLAGLQTRSYRGETLLSRILLTAFSLLFLNPSLTVRFRQVEEDKISAEEFRAFILHLVAVQKPGFTRAPEEDVVARLAKRKTLRGMINAVVNP